MMEYNPEKEYQKYKIDFIRRGDFLDTEYVFAESEFEAWDVPLQTEEYEEVEKVNVVVVSDI